MPDAIFNSATLEALGSSLDVLSRRHDAISHNIANVNTPGYKAISVSFEEQLLNKIAKQDSLTLCTTHPSHINYTSIAKAIDGVVHTRSQYGRVDKNTLDIDKETVKLAETNIMYAAAAQLLSAKLAQLHLIVSEGRG